MEVPCIKCGESGGYVKVDVEDGTLHCNSCDADYDVGDVRAAVNAWGKVLHWLEQHPALKPDPKPEPAAPPA